jgi:hypothetical protein
MARQKQDLEKVTIRLHEGDKDILEKYYPRSGYNPVIRQLVRRHIKQLEEKFNTTRSQADDTADTIDLNDIELPTE